MDRRSFFRLLGGAVAAPIIEPVASKIYVFAPRNGWLHKPDEYITTPVFFDDLYVRQYQVEILNLVKKKFAFERLILKPRSLGITHWAMMAEEQRQLFPIKERETAMNPVLGKPYGGDRK